MTIANRLNLLCQQKGIKKKALAEKIGVAQSTLQTWISRGQDFPAQFVVPICDVLGVTPLMLLSGANEQYTSEEEQYLLDLFRTLDHEGRVVVVNKAIEESRRIQSNGIDLCSRH